MTIDAAAQTADTSTDVLIIGGGPTGHCLSVDLARRGVTCRIVEQSTARRTAPKAINVHPRSLEIFADLGVIEEAIDLGNKVRRLNTYSVRDRPRRISQIDFTPLQTRFPGRRSGSRRGIWLAVTGSTAACGPRWDSPSMASSTTTTSRAQTSWHIGYRAVPADAARLYSYLDSVLIADRPRSHW